MVSPFCLDSAPGLVKAVLHPHPDYLLKVPFSIVHPVILEATCPPLFTMLEQERIHFLCPPASTAPASGVSQSSFSYAVKLQLGSAATKHTISHWLSDAIALAYEVCHQALPQEVRAHSTRSCIIQGFGKRCPLATSMRCVRLILSTFIKFYSLVVHALISLSQLPKLTSETSPTFVCTNYTILWGPDSSSATELVFYFPLVL